MTTRHGSAATVGDESAGNRSDLPQCAWDQSGIIIGRGIGGPETFLEVRLSRRGLLRKKCRLQMIDNPVNDSIRRQEGDNLHPMAPSRADHWVNLVDLPDHFRPALGRNAPNRLIINRAPPARRECRGKRACFLPTLPEVPYSFLESLSSKKSFEARASRVSSLSTRQLTEPSSNVPSARRSPAGTPVRSSMPSSIVWMG